jgi:hypothetical protein
VKPMDRLYAMPNAKMVRSLACCGVAGKRSQHFHGQCPVMSRGSENLSATIGAVLVLAIAALALALEARGLPIG